MLVKSGQMGDETGSAISMLVRYSARGAARPPRVTRTASGLAGRRYDMKSDLF